MAARVGLKTQARQPTSRVDVVTVVLNFDLGESKIAAPRDDAHQAWLNQLNEVYL